MDEKIQKMNRMNVSSIETFFDKLLRGNLTDNLFFNDLPPQIKETWKDFAIVNVINPIRDHDSHALGTVLIELYAKQNPYGIKNVKGLAELEAKLNEIVEGCEDENYHISRRGAYSHYDAVNDIYYIVVQISLVIT